jgi:hypothetical protein
MASSDFNQPLTERQNEAKAQRDELNDGVLKFLQEITGDLGSAERATKGLDMSEAVNPPIDVPRDAKVDKRLQIIEEFCEAERALSRAMLAFAGDLHQSRQNPNGEKMYQALRKDAIREMLAK